ncbi:hypothetical protein [Paludibaculum fermentans]|uniref:Uncharacterized protein n=1 Tax=Paludibaculum fermentans TaxID=1473598 RepID=A0A7S7NKV8_PALFE|nr:hypothetical protein [Paludibaculum fermentans]QOY85533.1 hypothetical protein IRI77_22195 [Paludibaculum fermentans]
MFGRGNWAILGLAKESLEVFRTNLENQLLMAASSQMAASAIARLYGADALGFNPFSAPRLDEEQELNEEQQAELAKFAITEREEGSEETLPEEILADKGYAVTAERFQLHPTMPWFGMWAVANDWKKASDLPSIKEQRSYVLLERPYRFLQATDKKTVDQETLGVTTIVRKQVPVLLDFNEGRVYIESTNKLLIYRIIVRLNLLAAQTIPVAWTFGTPNWTEEVLNRLYEKTQYEDEIVKRAEEAKRFSAKEIEKLEDRVMEAIVANYFSMTELPGGLWAGISGPAVIRLHATAPAIGVKAPTSATTLLRMTSDTGIVSGVLTFQECVPVMNKEGVERIIRRDLVRMQLNDKINLTDVGAAMLRGFDLSTHKKDVQREIKQTKQVPSIPQFWGNWLHQLGNAVRTIEGAFREILDVDGDQEGGIVPMQVPEKVESTETVSA